jgi:ADP-ribose pyrophosphatase
MDKEWKLLEKKKVFDNPWRPIEEWVLQTHLGEQHSFYIGIEPDVVIVVGVSKEKKFLTIEQYNYAQGKFFTTFVAGFVEKTDTPEHTAKRELQEETGCVAKEFVYLGSNVKGKYVTGVVHYYLALDVEQVGEQELESNEDIKVEWIDVERFKNVLAEQKFAEVFAEAGAYRALKYLKLL